METTAELRDTLATAFDRIDPQRNNPLMPEVVLVGHGMGGLLAKLQVTWSGDSPWKTVSNRPLEQIVATPTDRQQIARITYVAPAPRIRRVVYIYLNDWKFGQLSEVIDEFVHLKRTFFKRESR